jgi:SAM-dependent methyltransferase
MAHQASARQANQSFANTSQSFTKRVMAIVSARRSKLNWDARERGSNHYMGHSHVSSREWLADDYFSAGSQETADFMHRARILGYPRQRREALDFGCGLGRVTRALGDYFSEVVGVDIAPETVARARALNADYANCHFLLFDQPELEPFEDDRFDMVYSVLEVRQDSDGSLLIELARELLRVLCPSGLLLLRIADRLAFRSAPESESWTRRFFRRLRNLPSSVYYKVLSRRLNPIAKSQNDLLDLVVESRAQVLQIDTRQRHGRRGHGESRTFWITK